MPFNSVMLPGNTSPDSDFIELKDYEHRPVSVMLKNHGVMMENLDNIKTNLDYKQDQVTSTDNFPKMTGV